MGTIYVDGKPYEADPQQDLLHACLSLGFDLPYFCWHAALGSVGACRQCAVKQFKDEHDEHGRHQTVSVGRDTDEDDVARRLNALGESRLRVDHGSIVGGQLRGLGKHVRAPPALALVLAR